MKSFKYLSSSVDDTMNFGRRLGRFLKSGDIVCLYGDLGSGKTTLTKGVASGLKIDPNKVHSPTFIIMNEYKGKVPLYHFDFYRIDQTQEISLIGYEEFFFSEGISIIEWPERLKELLPSEVVEIQLSLKGKAKRLFKFSGQSLRSKEIVSKLNK